jgi:hypothetical protein
MTRDRMAGDLLDHSTMLTAAPSADFVQDDCYAIGYRNKSGNGLGAINKSCYRDWRTSHKRLRPMTRGNGRFIQEKVIHAG